MSPGHGLNRAAANETWKRAHQMLTLGSAARSTSGGIR
jgi:hypothetical protein